jgi:hypothetical protein
MLPTASNLHGLAEISERIRDAPKATAAIFREIMEASCRLPDWLDQSIQARHQDLALAILAAFVEAQALTTPLSQPSVPTVRHETRTTYVAASCDNFV